jgi:ABC-type antimicrobial peptide transport system permease subunit
VAYDGVVEQDTRRYLGLGDHADARAERFDVYFSLAQTPSTVVSIGVSTTGNAASLIAPVRQAIARIAPASPVHWTSVMEDEIAIEYAPSRFYSVIVVVFSLSALLLTSIGLFALLSHAAAQRTSEMGLRIALGAHPRATGWLIMRTALLPLGCGVTGGLVGAALASRAMQSMLYDTAPLDAFTFAGAVAVLLSVTVAAALLPARRMALLDPVRTLKGD